MRWLCVDAPARKEPRPGPRASSIISLTVTFSPPQSARTRLGQPYFVVASQNEVATVSARLLFEAFRYTTKRLFPSIPPCVTIFHRMSWKCDVSTCECQLQQLPTLWWPSICQSELGNGTEYVRRRIARFHLASSLVKAMRSVEINCAPGFHPQWVNLPDNLPNLPSWCPMVLSSKKTKYCPFTKEHAHSCLVIVDKPIQLLII